MAQRRHSLRMDMLGGQPSLDLKKATADTADVVSGPVADTRGSVNVMSMRPTAPCKRCGGPKVRGNGVRYCTPCKMAVDAERKPTCTRCGGPKTGTGRGRGHCLDCAAIAQAAHGPNRDEGQPWQPKDQRRKYALRYNFGITPEEYADLLDAQDGRCAICGNHPRTKNLAVDHSHSSGIIRGLLCSYCNNQLLGGARDSIKLLQLAVAYLLDPPAQHVMPGRKVPPKRKKRTTP